MGSMNMSDQDKQSLFTNMLGIDKKYEDRLSDPPKIN